MTLAYLFSAYFFKIFPLTVDNLFEHKCLTSDYTQSKIVGMGKIHSKEHCEEIVSGEQNRFDTPFDDATRNNKREQTKIKREWKPFFRLEKLKTHSILVSSLRSTLNALEHLVQKLKRLPLLKHSQHNFHHQWIKDDSFNLDEIKSDEEHPIIVSANNLKDSLREARQLLEDLSFTSNNTLFNINKVTGKDNLNQIPSLNFNLTDAGTLVEKDEGIIQSKQLKRDSTTVQQQTMRLQAEPLCNEDEEFSESILLTESIIILPSNVKNEKTETILLRTDLNTASAIYQDGKAADDGVWLKQATESARRDISTKNKLQVKEADEISKNEKHLTDAKQTAQEKTEMISFNSKSLKGLTEIESQSPSSRDSSYKEFAEKTLMKPEVFFHWRHGACETIEEEEEVVEEELQFDVSLCSSPRSDLIFDSLQDDDELLEQLTDLRDDPDYAALLENETSSFFAKSNEDNQMHLFSEKLTDENQKEDLKSKSMEECTGYHNDEMENKRTDFTEQMKLESDQIKMSSKQLRSANYGEYLLEEISTNFNEIPMIKSNEKSNNEVKEIDYVVKDSDTSISVNYSQQIDNYFKETINDVMRSALSNASKMLLENVRILSKNEQNENENQTKMSVESEIPEIGEWLFRRSNEILKLDRENRINNPERCVHLSHSPGYILLNNT